ncbi:MAG: MBL fold metallo-hydrolase [Holdemanella sp.]|nr:MBL fold metallo-hydrolase [Holdemanella sp.]
MTKIVKVILIIGIILTLIILFLFFWKPFGSNPSAKQKEEYAKRTTNYYDGKFHPLTEFKLMSNKEKTDETSKETKPANGLPIQKLSKLEEADENEWQLTWFGHSSVLLQFGGKKIFIDPVLSSCSSPFNGIGPGRMADVPMNIEDIPDIDILVLSHDHYDHMDYNTITKLDNRVKAYCVPLGVDNHLIRWGINPDKIHTFAWWEHNSIEGISITSTPGQHFSGRFLWNRDSTLWCGYVFKANNQQIYYSGDTGYGDFFKDIYERLGPMDLAIMENGQYNKRWPYCHMTPEESVQASMDVQTKWVLPVHWGGFVLSTHAWYDPIERFTKAAKDDLQVLTPKIGETVNQNNAEKYQSIWW